jgi:hypothetical protein
MPKLSQPSSEGGAVAGLYRQQVDRFCTSGAWADVSV